MVTLFVIARQWTKYISRQYLNRFLGSSAEDYLKQRVCYLPVIGSDNGQGACWSERQILKHCLQQGQLLKMVFNRYSLVTGGNNVILIVKDLNLSQS